MAFLNNYRHISGILLIISLTIISCKKEEQHTSFYQESARPYADRTDLSVTQPIQNTLEAFRFTNYPGTASVMNPDSVPYELLWLRAQKSSDLIALSSSAAVDDNSRTQIRVLYDASALYISIYCWDQKISKFPTLLSNGQDFRDKTDVVTVYLVGAPPSNMVYILEATPQGFHSDGTYNTTTNTKTFPANYPGTIITCKQSNNQSNFNGWYAEIKVPFSSSSSLGFDFPTAGTTTWKMNVVRQNYYYNGTTNLIEGKYAWKTPSSIEEDPSVFYNVFFSAQDLTTVLFKYNLRGTVISSGAVNLPDCGFVGKRNNYPYQTSTQQPFNISLGKKVNPGIITTSIPVSIGDSITYYTYVKRPDGSYSQSYTEQKELVR